MINLNKMTPAAATRLLNSTPLGTVLKDRQISGHLQRAGYRIAGDAEGKTVNLLKFVAYLVDARSSRISANVVAGRTYERKKEASRERSAEESQSGRDIGSIPEVVNPERKEACRNSLLKFLQTYFPEIFYLEFGELHYYIIKKLERIVLSGGKVALAMPRATGKSRICERAALWATAYGYRKFAVIIGESEDAAWQNIDQIKNEIELNEIFCEDFPEISYPIKKLERIVNRCKGQTCQGKATRIIWSDYEMAFPTLAGCESSGAVIRARGITGQVRGQIASINGKAIRPDLVIIDDPQTRESAESPQQCKKRLRIIFGDILGMAGPGKKIACFMPCTVIRPDDVADQILSRDKHPDWLGERWKLMESFPTNMELWNRYQEIRADSFREYENISQATEFYRNNRAAMDAGAKVTWPTRFNHDEISGIQYAMNLFFDSKETFYAEYQNEPLPDDEGASEKITVQTVWDRLNNRKRGEIPLDAEHIVMFVDVQGKLLYYKVCAFADNFTGYIVDYGAFPDQKRRYFSLKEAKPTFQEKYSNAGWEGALFSALGDLTGDLLSRPWQREDGAELYIEKCLIDSAWGDSTKTVYKFCKESPFSRILLPSKGRGITAAQRPMTEYRRETGVKLGFNWRVFRVRGQASARLFEYDTNFWKSFFRQRLFSAPGDPGSFTIFGSDEEQHRLLAEQLSSEVATVTTGGGRRVDIWKLIPGRENHWLDGVVGCMALASMQGCDLSFEGIRSKHRPAAARKTPEPVTTPAAKRIVPAGRITPHR